MCIRDSRSPICTVDFSMVRVMSSGQKYSFQQLMKSTTPSEATAPRMLGSTTRIRVEKGPAPSIWAASKMVRGKELKL